MSIETRNFGARVSSLVQDISMLTQTIPLTAAYAEPDNHLPPSSTAAAATAREIKMLTLPQEMPQRADNNLLTATSSCTRPQYHTLPLVLPMTRAHSQPLSHHVMHNWTTEIKSMTAGDREELSGTSTSRTGEHQQQQGSGEESHSDGVSQESQEDFEVKVIHSSLLDNHHHMIVVSSPCPSAKDLHSSSDESLNDMYTSNEKKHVDETSEFPLPLDMEDVFDI